jgi:hypothetical protein
MNTSVEGIILANKVLSSLEIDDVAKRLAIVNYRGCYCRDELAKIFYIGLPVLEAGPEVVGVCKNVEY